MTAYRFRAARSDGEIVLGTVEAGTAAAALADVSNRGLFLLGLDETAAATRPHVGVNADLAAALGGMAALLDAGLPADRALAAAAETSGARLAAALTVACERVREGLPVSSALETANAVPPLVAALIRAGERSGALAPAMARAAAELERELDARARLRAALTYPVFVAVVGTASVAVIAGFVVPRFAALLGDQSRQLPAATRLLLAISGAVTGAGAELLVGTAIAVVLIWTWARTPAGRLLVHRALLETPLIGALRHRFASARVCTALGTLLDAGVPMLAALDRCAETAGDLAVRERLGRARADVIEGERLTAAIRRHRALSDGAQRLAAFGESSGRLGHFLAHAGQLEAAAAFRAVQRMVSLVEPLLILLFGALVAFVATALFQAMYSVRLGL